MSLNIALHTTQIPRVTSPHQDIITIINLTPARATELLDLMNDITMRACASSTTFKISSFEPSALYVPAYALRDLPSPDDFVILPPDYSIAAVTPIKLVHANVMPLFVNWTASDENERFLVNTAELDAEILKLVARGETLVPGSTSYSVKNARRPSPGSLVTQEGDWLH
jgi:hypothetical protein